jgi:hypothetical protein
MFSSHADHFGVSMAIRLRQYIFGWIIVWRWVRFARLWERFVGVYLKIVDAFRIFFGMRETFRSAVLNASASTRPRIGDWWSSDYQPHDANGLPKCDYSIAQSWLKIVGTASHNVIGMRWIAKDCAKHFGVSMVDWLQRIILGCFIVWR